MKICYIYREKEKNEHSIEAVFDTVADQLHEYASIEKWYKPVGLLKAIKSLLKLRRQRFDLYHITGDVYYLWLFLPWRKTLMTVHDIGMYKNNPWSLKRWLFVFVGITLASLFVRKITCVSNLTQNDLYRYLSIPPKSTSVISNPLSQPFCRYPKEFNHEYPRILQIGTGWHKNLDTLIKSVKNINCHLDIIGSPYVELIEEMKRSHISFSISCGISTNELEQHYRDCDILYFVSRSEGFGLPILEAQTIGRPVITSCTEPTKTIAGEGALLCHPEDPEAINNAINRLIRDRKLRQELIKQGYKNSSGYSKESIARQYLSLYQSLIK